MFRKSSDPVLISEECSHMQAVDSKGELIHAHRDVLTHVPHVKAKNKLLTPAWSSICALLISQCAPLFITGSEHDKPTAVLTALTNTSTHAQLFWQPYVWLTKRCEIPVMPLKATGQTRARGRGAPVWLLDCLNFNQIIERRCCGPCKVMNVETVRKRLRGGETQTAAYPSVDTLITGYN